ncbi:MAG TPA: transcriptional regulator CecR [Clostridia bacterium]|nr:transcriptional regulator CecR [Clostridia bacterium]
MAGSAFAFLQPEPRKGDRARVRLLAAALRVFADKGLRGASVREIAREAGQNVAAIAYYFGSKEKLYRALMEGLAREVHIRVGDVVEEIQALRERGNGTPADGVRLFQAFLRTVYLRLLSRSEAVEFGRLVVPEQLAPTAGFEILYDQAFRQLHEALCFTVGLAIGLDPRDKETIVRTHMLMGQVYFFAMTREAILRRLHWKDLEGQKAEWVAGLLAEHTELLLTGLAARLKSSKK